MILRNSLNFISQIFSSTSNQIRKIYLISDYYDKKISKIYNEDIFYKPSPHLLSSLIKYQTNKINVDDITTENLWNNENINNKNFKKLNSFYWFFGLDLKSSKKKHKKLYQIGLKKILNIILKVGNLI